MVEEAVAVERVRVGVLVRVVLVVEVEELAVGEEVVAFMGEEEAFVGDDALLGVDEDGVDGSGNSLGWCRVDTMVEGVSEVDGRRVNSELGRWGLRKEDLLLGT